MVYCRSDAACLCLSCDRNVHSANALSKRHTRTLVCERCNSQPASVRCIDEGISLCQNCNFVGHDASNASSFHKTQSINYYSGCPSSAELSTIWSFISDIPLPSSKDSTCQEGLGSPSTADNAKNPADPVAKDSRSAAGAMAGAHDLKSIDSDCAWTGPSSVPELGSREWPGRPECTDSSQMFYHNTEVFGFCEDDPYADLDMDEVDINLENYEELFGYTLTHSEQLLENGGINSLFMRKGTSTADSNCHGGPVEGSSAGMTNQMQPTCSNAASGDSVVSIKTEPNLGFGATQAQSGLSFSGIAGETSADYQDCGASSMLLLGEPPWCPPCPENSLQSASRTEAVMRYKEKKKTRKFEKTVRYASRKARADVRKRVKGRFVKAGDAYDYDPLSHTRSI